MQVSIQQLSIQVDTGGGEGGLFGPRFIACRRREPQALKQRAAPGNTHSPRDPRRYLVTVVLSRHSSLVGGFGFHARAWR